MAMINPRIQARSIDATQFPDLARRYGVYGVPKTVIDDRVEVEGAVPESALLEAFLRAVDGANGASGGNGENVT